MNYLNAKQLAFLLDIDVQEARKKIVYAYCKEKGEPVPTKRVKQDDIKKEEAKAHKEWLAYSEYPIALSIEILSVRLNLPTLQQSVDDIENNYLNRPGSKKWILCDYPEKKIKSFANTDGGKKKLTLPGALASMLPKAIQDKIYQEWRERFPKWTV
jgi:hypothetical protein